MMLSIICVCVCVCFAYVYVCRRFIPPVNHLVPKYPGWLPIVGNAYKLFRVDDIGDLIMSLGKFSYEQGGVMTFFAGPYPFYIITDPDDASTVLHRCLKKTFIYKLIEPLVGKMLVAAEVPTWKRNRRIVDLSFKQKLLDGYLDVFIEEADHLVQAMEEYVGQEEVDITDKITRSFLETTCRTTLGSTPDGQVMVNDNYVAAVDTFMEIITLKFCKPWYLIDPIFKMTRYAKEIKNASETFFNLAKKMVKLRIEEHLQRLKNKDLDLDDDRLRSFLDVLVENSVTETGCIYTEKEMRNLVDNILLAAFDTTIRQIILLLVCIGSHHEVQQKIHQEIMDVLGDNDKVTKDNIHLLVYLEAVIKECVRLYPIAFAVTREASTDVQLRNYTIPAGSFIVVHLWAVNRNPEFWGEDAEEFKPERWFKDSLPEHTTAFASFSPGRRGCPGKQYTLMLFKATLVPLIRKYKFTADHTKLKLDFNVMLKPRSGHHIKIEYR